MSIGHVFEKQILEFMPRLISGIVIFAAFYIMARICQTAVKTICQRKSLDRDVVDFFAKMTKIAIVILGGVSALGTMDINVSALVASLGLTGFALGFALKDLLANIIAGLMILIHRPFRREDRIMVGGFEGLVKEIDLRYTTLENGRKFIYVPNSIIFTQGITVIRDHE